MKKTSGGNKKKRSAALALGLACLLAVGGTLTYFTRTSATNPFSDVAKKKEVVAHDDFDPKTGNKDVYMENTGEAEAYVRVKLTEDFKISPYGGVAEGETIDDVAYTTKYAHKVENERPFGEHVHKTTGVGSDVTVSDDTDFHSKYFKWMMGGEGKSYLSGKDALYTAGTDTNVLMGGDDGKVAQDNLGTGIENGTASNVKTAPDCVVITMDDYMSYTDNNRRNFVGWVMDSDGWCYWSQKLPAKEATGLLLNQVDVQNMLKNNDYDYQYHIHVAYEAVDDGDKGLWTTNTQTTDATGAEVGNGNTTEQAKQMLEMMETIIGEDGKEYRKNLDGTYLQVETGLVVEADENGNVGTGNNKTVGAEPNPIPTTEENYFQFTNATAIQAHKMQPGGSLTIQLEDSEGNLLDNSDFSFSVVTVEDITVTQDGVVNVASTVGADNKNATIYAVSKETGVKKSLNVTTKNVASENNNNYVLKSIYDFEQVAGTNKVVKVGAAYNSLQSDNTGMPANIDSIRYEIEGSDTLGCTMTESGILKTGSQTGKLKVKVIVTATNHRSTSITIDDPEETVAAGATYTREGYTTVKIVGESNHGETCADAVTAYSGRWEDVEASNVYAGGDGTKQSPYLISCVHQMKKLQQDIALDGVEVATYGKYYKLTTDLDLTGCVNDRELIGSFYGNFDGGNHKIIGFVNTASGGGIFAVVSYGGVENLARVGGSTEVLSVGSPFIRTLSEGAFVKNCYNTATATNNGGVVSGIVGVLQTNSRVENCMNYGDIGGAASWSAAGIVGVASTNYANGTNLIVNCHNFGTISSGKSGGLIGRTFTEYANIVVRNSTNSGKVIGQKANQAGAIIADINKTNEPSSITFENVVSLKNLVSNDGGTTFVEGNAIARKLCTETTTIIGAPTVADTVDAPTAKPF